MSSRGESRRPVLKCSRLARDSLSGNQEGVAQYYTIGGANRRFWYPCFSLPGLAPFGNSGFLSQEKEHVDEMAKLLLAHVDHPHPRRERDFRIWIELCFDLVRCQKVPINLLGSLHCSWLKVFVFDVCFFFWVLFISGRGLFCYQTKGGDVPILSSLTGLRPRGVPGDPGTDF